jgi:hypothetical protein
MSEGRTRRGMHLARRFVTSLWPAAPAPADDAWVRDILDAEPYALWRRLPNHDRRHSIVVARRVQRALDGTDHHGDDRWLAAALLHDVGKLDARLGVFGRVGATLAGAAGGLDMAAIWSEKRGITRRVGLYLRHPEIGADHIRVAGGPDTAARWAAVHHDRGAWDATGIPTPVLTALHDADDD